MTSTLPPLVQALSGSIGSASASTLTYPLDLITTRLQLDSSVNAQRRGGGGMRKGRVVEGLGWKALYDGLKVDLVATLLSNFFYFYFYSFLRSLSTRGLSASVALPALRRVLGLEGDEKTGSRRHAPTLVEDLVLGFVAGVASRAVSTPLNIITLRLQEERADAAEDDDSEEEEDSESGKPVDDISLQDAGVMDVARMIYEEEGIKGFWKGFGTSALLSVNPSITLAFFQLFRNGIVHLRFKKSLRVPVRHVHSNLSPLEAFFVGAIANSIASTILYPLILAKKRLQSGAGLHPNATLFSVLRDAYMGRYDPHAPRIPLDNSLARRPSARRARSSRHWSGGEKTEGLQGLYQGLQMQILKGFFGQGTTFLVKGRIELLVIALYMRRRVE